MPNITCPMHPDPKPVCDDQGLCPLCGREWERLGHLVISKPRRVVVTKPLIPGEKIDDCLQPVKEN